MRTTFVMTNRVDIRNILFSLSFILDKQLTSANFLVKTICPGKWIPHRPPLFPRAGVWCGGGGGEVRKYIKFVFSPPLQGRRRGLRKCKFTFSFRQEIKGQKGDRNSRVSFELLTFATSAFSTVNSSRILARGRRTRLPGVATTINNIKNYVFVFVATRRGTESSKGRVE